MFKPRILFNRLLPALRPGEKLLLEKLASMLHEPAATRFREHVDKINYVQRDADGLEVRFYRIYGGRVVFPVEGRLLSDPAETMIARLALRSRASAAVVNVEIWCVHGCLGLFKSDSPMIFDAGGLEVADMQWSSRLG